MRITSVEIIPTWDDLQTQPVLMLRSDSGRRGFGEITGDRHGTGSATVSAAIRTLLVGRDPFESHGLALDAIERADEVSNDAALIAAAETAMADLSGQELGVPVHQLLGGRVRDHVRACCIGWASGVAGTDATVRAALAAVDQGFTALRLEPFGSHGLTGDALSSADALIRELRDALPQRIDLVVDATGIGGLEDAIGLAELLAPSEVLWLELPFTETDVSAMEQRSIGFAVPVAAARATTPGALVRLVRGGLVDHLVIDVGAAGGLRAARRIAALAEIYHVGLIPSATGRVSLATSLHLAASVPNLTMVEMTPGIGRLEAGMIAIDLKAGLGWDDAPPTQEVA